MFRERLHFICRPGFRKHFGYQPFLISREIWLLTNTGFVVPKHWSGQPDFDRLLLRLLQSGIVDKILKKYDFTEARGADGDEEGKLEQFGVC